MTKEDIYITGIGRGPLSSLRLEVLKEKGGFQRMISTKTLPIGARVEVLNSWGETREYIVTNQTSQKVVDRDIPETWAKDSEGQEIVLDSSFSDCFDVGWRYKVPEVTQ